MSEQSQLIADKAVGTEQQQQQQQEQSTSDLTWLYILVGALVVLLLFGALIAALVMYRRASSGEDVPVLSRWLTGQQKREAAEEGESLESEDLEDL